MFGSPAHIVQEDDDILCHAFNGERLPLRFRLRSSVGADGDTSVSFQVWNHRYVVVLRASQAVDHNNGKLVGLGIVAEFFALDVLDLVAIDCCERHFQRLELLGPVEDLSSRRRDLSDVMF